MSVNIPTNHKAPLLRIGAEPNCLKCGLRLEVEYPPGLYRSICIAQECLKCCDVWNTEECKQLYEVSE